MTRPSKPDMHDPADQDIHSGAGKKPYPTPSKVTRPANPDDDLEDPAKETPGAPHDRGVQKADGRYEDNVDDMIDKVKDDPELWRKGKTQNTPPRKR